MTNRRNVLLALGMAAWLFGLEPVSAADVGAGKTTAESCAACHGTDGISQTADTPSLAGQPDDYIQWQLVYFRRGARKNELMESVAQALTNEEIRNLGAYYASLPAPKPEPAAASDTLAQTGAKLAAQRRCASCHGDDYVGVGPAARLSGQREDVLLKALHDFKSGSRVGSGVASMAEVTFALNDADMQALAHYMANAPLK
jgi:cytochrome c553